MTENQNLDTASLFIDKEACFFPEIVWWPEKSIILTPSAPIVLDSLRSTVLSN